MLECIRQALAEELTAIAARPAPSRQNVPAPSRQNVPAPFRRNVPAPFRRNVPAPSRRNVQAPSRRNVPAPSREEYRAVGMVQYSYRMDSETGTNIRRASIVALPQQTKAWSKRFPPAGSMMRFTLRKRAWVYNVTCSLASPGMFFLSTFS